MIWWLANLKLSSCCRPSLTFDAQFLISDIKRFESPAPRGVILDSLPISRKVFPGLANYKLGTLVQHLKIPSAGFHRAEEDATYCGHLFLELMKRISVGGKAPQLENLVALTGKPEARFPQIVRQPKQMDFIF
jgi:DNA polymerase-3 subunit epsilon